MPPRYRPWIRIRATAAGFVEPSPCSKVRAASIFDGDIERAIAAQVEADAFPAGLYLAEWEDERGQRSRYIFRVTVETRHVRAVEVEP